jgi:hypothetical protein
VRARRASLVLLPLIFVACGRNQPSAPRAASPSPTPPKPVVCPLTGEERPPVFAITRPALGVKIDNIRAARPQAGLESADIVYEELAEGGITRFLAIYHCSDASELGPVRSARLVDPDILEQYTPVLFAYSGGNPIVKEKIKDTSGLVDLRFGSNSKAFVRKKGRPAPNNLFTSTDQLRGLSEVRGAPKLDIAFASPAASPTPPKASPSPARASPGAPPSPSPVEGQAVGFAFAGGRGVKYTFDPAAAKYLRTQDGEPHKAITGSQLTTTNVVVLKVKVVPGSIRDAAGNVSPEISVVGEGEAIFLAGGVATKGKWSRPKESDKTKYTGPDGKPYAFAKGSIWIHLLPSDRPVTLE